MNFYLDSLLNSLLLQLDAQQVSSEHFTQAFFEQVQIEAELEQEHCFEFPQLSPYAPLEF